MINRCDLGHEKSLQHSSTVEGIPDSQTEPPENFRQGGYRGDHLQHTKNLWDRLILELQARCGLRIGESLKFRVSDISERQIVLREPKSGKEAEVPYMPEPIAKRLEEYIRNNNLGPEDPSV